MHPGREIRRTFAQNLLTQIAADIAGKKAPLAKLEDLYRDEIHLTHDAGKYLMQNAMRLALGEPARDRLSRIYLAIRSVHFTAQ